LTESVIAPGNKQEGNRAKCAYSQVVYCMHCSHIDWYDESRAKLAACIIPPPLDRWDARIAAYQQHIDQIMQARTPRSKNRYALGPREFTLTYSPKWFDNDVDARMALSQALDKLIKYHRNEITRLRAVGEVGTNGASHIHCYYELQGGRKMTDKNFKRAWRYWDPSKKHGNGFQGGHHDAVKNTADFLGYIDKDINTAWLDINIGS